MPPAWSRRFGGLPVLNQIRLIWLTQSGRAQDKPCAERSGTVTLHWVSYLICGWRNTRIVICAAKGKFIRSDGKMLDVFVRDKHDRRPVAQSSSSAQPDSLVKSLNRSQGTRSVSNQARVIRSPPSSGGRKISESGSWVAKPKTASVTFDWPLRRTRCQSLRPPDRDRSIDKPVRTSVGSPSRLRNTSMALERFGVGK